VQGSDSHRRGLVEESKRLQAEFDLALQQAVLELRKPVETRIEIIDEPYEAPSGGRQLTETELRGILYEGVCLMLEGKKGQAATGLAVSLLTFTS
jgi:hypothetical protein